MNLRTVIENEILPRVEKPSRYLGTEENSTHKDLDAIELRISLVFPDLYDLGLGNVGILILYSILNDLPWCWCERAYSPANDMEAQLRERGLPLFCNFWQNELSQVQKNDLTENQKKNFEAKPKIFNKNMITFLPASHSMGLDLLYFSVAVYAVIHILKPLFI